jgi:hypothetical protein
MRIRWAIGRSSCAFLRTILSAARFSAGECANSAPKFGTDAARAARVHGAPLGSSKCSLLTKTTRRHDHGSAGTPPAPTSYRPGVGSHRGARSGWGPVGGVLSSEPL